MFYGCIWNDNPILGKYICQQFLLLYARPISVLLFVFCCWQHTLWKIDEHWKREEKKAPIGQWFLDRTLNAAPPPCHGKNWAAWWEAPCYGLPWLLSSRIALSHHSDHAKKLRASLNARWARRFARKQYLNHPQLLNLIEQVFKIQMWTRSRLLININQTVASFVKGATTASWRCCVT